MKFSIALWLLTAALGVSQTRTPAPAVSAYRPVAPARNSTTPATKYKTATTFGSNTGWGSVANPGTGHPPNTTPSGYSRNSYNTGTGRGKGRNNSYGYPAYGIPVYIPGYADSLTANPGDQNEYPPERRPVVIQNFYPSSFNQPPVVQQQAQDESGMQTYIAPPSQSAVAEGAGDAAASNNYYLIAYKDHHIYTALAYWMEGSTVHYVTTQNVHNQAALDAIDVDLTKRLNQDRNMSLNGGQ